MCVSPQYQRMGIGSKLVIEIQARATKRQKSVFLQATPAGTPLYLKHGFKVLAEAEVELNQFGEDRTYVQRTMSCEPCEQQDGGYQDGIGGGSTECSAIGRVLVAWDLESH